MTTGACKLCLCNDAVLVNSHIIPRSFYEEYKGKPLIAFSEITDKKSTIRKGIFGKFLCCNCEKKFDKVDQKAFKLIKSVESFVSLAKDELKRKLLIIENANANKDLLHKFALTVLWRAKNSIRQEYPSIKLGCYEEKIRLAIHTSQFEQSLLDATGFMLWEFRGSNESEPDASGYAYRVITKKSNPNFSDVYGNFKAHIFGYPYGEIIIRLGGEKPKQGYFHRIEETHKPSVLWSTNSDKDFPNLVVSKMPRIRDDGHLTGTNFQKEIFSIIVKARINNEDS